MYPFLPHNLVESIQSFCDHKITIQDDPSPLYSCTVSPEITSGTLDRTFGPIHALSLPTNPVIEGELVSFLQFRGGALYFSSARSRPLREQIPKNRSAFYLGGGGVGSIGVRGRSLPSPRKLQQQQSASIDARFPPLTFYGAAFSRHSLFADCGKRFRGNPHTSI